MRRTALVALVLAASLAGASPASAHHPWGDRIHKPPDDRFPLSVWVSPELPGTVAEAIAGWNALVPGLTLFTVAPTWKEADVRAIIGRQSGADCHTRWPSGEWVRCLVRLEREHAEAPYGPAVLAHELGHVLGFADHPSPEFYTPDVGLRVCGDPDHPAYHPYAGVMTYCTLAFDDADARMIAREYGHLAIP